MVLEGQMSLIQSICTKAVGKMFNGAEWDRNQTKKSRIKKPLYDMNPRFLTTLTQHVHLTYLILLLLHDHYASAFSL